MSLLGDQHAVLGGPDFVETVRSLASHIEAGALQAEADRALPRFVVDHLRHAGLFWLKTPRELGGTELDPLEFSDILEEVAYYDASAAWAVMVGNGVTGTLGGLLDDDGAAEVFGPAGRPRLPIGAGQFVPRGTGVAVDGGYRVSGRWSFCSGISHADWVVGAFPAAPDGALRLFAVPKAEADVHDVWHVAGLQGTSSDDFSLTNHFVPASRVFDPLGPPRRGGPLFRQPYRIFVGNEVPAVTLGITRRAIDDMTSLAAETSRARSSASSVADRAVFQHTLGRVDAMRAAARALFRETVSDAWSQTLADTLDGTSELLFMSRTTRVVELCIECVAALFPFAGGRALSLTNPMQRHYRNLLAAGQHVSLSNENYERTGQVLIARGGAAR